MESKTQPSQQDRLAKQAKQKEQLKRDIQQKKNAYKDWEGSLSHKDLIEHLESESRALEQNAKNRFYIVDGKVVPLDDGTALSLLYKSAGLDMALQYIKTKLS